LLTSFVTFLQDFFFDYSPYTTMWEEAKKTLFRFQSFNLIPSDEEKKKIYEDYAQEVIRVVEGRPAPKPEKPEEPRPTKKTKVYDLLTLALYPFFSPPAHCFLQFRDEEVKVKKEEQAKEEAVKEEAMKEEAVKEEAVKEVVKEGEEEAVKEEGEIEEGEIS